MLGPQHSGPGGTSTSVAIPSAALDFPGGPGALHPLACVGEKAAEEVV